MFVYKNEKAQDSHIYILILFSNELFEIVPLKLRFLWYLVLPVLIVFSLSIILNYILIVVLWDFSNKNKNIFYTGEYQQNNILTIYKV